MTIPEKSSELWKKMRDIWHLFIKYPFFLSLFLFIFFLLANTSFTIMGVDISQFIGGFLQQNLAIIVKSVLRVFVVQYLFLTGLFIAIDFVFKQYGKSPAWTVSAILFSLLLSLLHSIVMHPQLYGEFFYIRYPGILAILYFLTDHTTPMFFAAALYVLIAIFAVFWLKKYQPAESKNYLLHTGFLANFFYFHFSGNPSGLFFLILLFLLFYCIREKISVRVLPVFIILPLVFTIWQHIPFQTSKPGYNLLLLSADSLRYDETGKKINGKSVTPHIDQLAKESFVFHDHHVTIPRTFPSWVDLLTGQYSMTHKIRAMFPAPEEKRNINSASIKTIAHLLQEKGIATAVISGFAGDIFPRLDFGFAQVDAPSFTADILSVQRILESQLLLLPVVTGSFFSGGDYLAETGGLAALGDDNLYLPKVFEFLKKHKSNPFFLTYFSSVAHFPYSPPWPYYKQFSSKSYYGKYKYLKFIDPAVNDKPDEKEIEQIRSLYHNSIHAFDDAVGKILGFLKASGMYENTIIIVTADHGESIYEDIHGHGHGEHLRGDHVTHVPLLIRLPDPLLQKNGLDNTPKNRFAITSAIDLFPTIAAIYNLSANHKGIDLFSEHYLNQDLAARYVYAETGIWFSDKGDHFFQKQRIRYPDILHLHRIVEEENNEIMITDPFYRSTIAFSKHRALISKNYKLIYIPTNDGIQFELYDRQNDPFNRQNLYGNTPVSRKMKEELFKIVRENENARIIGDYIYPVPF